MEVTQIVNNIDPYDIGAEFPDDEYYGAVDPIVSLIVNKKLTEDNIRKVCEAYNKDIIDKIFIEIKNRYDIK